MVRREMNAQQFKAYLLVAVLAGMTGCADSQEGLTHDLSLDASTPGFQQEGPQDGLHAISSRQELVRGNNVEPSSLDPHMARIDNERNILADLFEGLVTLDQDGNILPGVAQSWESEGSRVFIFQLRQDARWSNGDPVVAEDFVYGWRRAVTPGTASRCPEVISESAIENSAAISKGEQPVESLGVRAITSHTLEVRLERPVSYLVSMLQQVCFLPLHSETLATHGERWTRADNLVGNGAFYLSEWRVNERVVLEKNRNYWGAESVRLNKVTFLPIAADMQFSRYMADDLDMTFGIPVDQRDRVKSSHPAEINVVKTYGSFGITINIAKPPLDNPDVRLALAYALDRGTIASKVYKGGSPAFTNVPPEMPSMSSALVDLGGLSQSDREARARDFLALAGFSREKPLELKLNYLKTPNNKKLALAVSAMWKKVLGADITLEALEWKSIVERVQNGDLELGIRGFGAAYPDPASILNYRLSGNSPGYGYASDRFDSIMLEATRTSDPVQRAELYAQAEIVLGEDMPYIPVTRLRSSMLVKPRVRGMQKEMAYPPLSKDLWVAVE
ncbi:peptide ABC transporter substrate-binding protein [Biformimicrobium ophioploci]|uniref:ABC transporter substrate-binding protein n=1 Tax=Biformimicrobium ophioploci TaxID=3036711 RepID=A0ABQ6LZQ9_9GAMM|nr:peptide ABC transporter substrate-binding protein [Microbulbifer sp. NKW57]GMG87537.1 ABC transporter substrate-binding protein [Microbulbifer sp. NKW57]